MIAFEQLEKKIRELVAADPKNVYVSPGHGKTCSYVSGPCINGSKGCIFGQAILALRPDLRDSLIAFDLREDTSIRYLLQDLGCNYTDKQVNWCQRLQNEQDIQTGWANTLAAADIHNPLT